MFLAAAPKYMVLHVNVAQLSPQSTSYPAYDILVNYSRVLGLFYCNLSSLSLLAKYEVGMVRTS